MSPRIMPALRAVVLCAIGLGAAPARSRGSGDLDHRLALSFQRLSQPDYDIGSVLADKIEPSWPGDVQGRLVLAWTALAQATGREPPQLKALVAGLPATFNRDGYLGPLLDLNAINEQQLSGHGWLISGLCHYADYSGDRRPLAWVDQMIHNLALPLRGAYRRYPRTPDDRNRNGGTVGRLTGRTVNGWRVSTDVGCAYIFLEGLVSSYRERPSPELASLIDEVAEAFLSTDVVAIQAQTHAALCGARNLLLYDKAAGFRHGWLPRLEAFYTLYRTRAMTENEANWNWFGRPSWTEPCAIVDSFLLAMELWRATAHASYLDDAHRIFYNGLGYGQKTDGGFGSDAFSREGGLAIANRHWDIPWCCNMRGACGLAGAAAAREEWRAGPGVLILPFYSDGAIRAGGYDLSEETDWPLEAVVTIRGRREPGAPPTLHQLNFFIPSACPPSAVRLQLDDHAIPAEVRNSFAAVSLPPGVRNFTVRLAMALPVRIERPHNPATRADLVTVRYGYLLLGTPDGQTLSSLRLEDLKPLGAGRFKVDKGGLVLVPLCEMPFSEATPAAPWRTQVLFNPD